MLNKQFDVTKIGDRLLLRAIQLRRPLSCTFELTYRCNFRCRMCYIRMNDGQAAPFGQLRTVDEWLDMARQIRDAGVLYLTLTGGECTLYPGFERLYPALYQMGFRLTVMSNGAAFTDEIRALFQEYPPHNAAISLYGGSNETYAAVTGDPLGLDRTLAGIRFLRGIGVPVHLNFTMVKLNAADYPLIAKLASSLGLSYTLITDITAHNRDASFSDALRVRLSAAERACIACHPPHEAALALENAKTLEKELEHFTMPQPVEDDPGLHACIGAYSTAAIYWNGEMNTCISLAGSHGYKPFEIGFEEAWRQLQADHAKRFRRPAVCVACPVRQDCLHSCAARNFEATGDPEKPDPYTCEYVWLLTKYREQTQNKQHADTQSCQSELR